MSMIEKYAGVPTTCISDGMKGQGHMDAAIKPLKESYQAVGRALTVKMVPGDNQIVLKAIREAKPGDVLVVDAKGDSHHAIAGDFVLGMMQTMGIRAVVVDGAIRDIADAKALDFPVFCKVTTMAAGNKHGAGEMNVPISCGGIVVNPGDIVACDADGVIAVPERIAETVLEKALEKERKDDEREASIGSNPEKVIAHLDKVLKK